MEYCIHNKFLKVRISTCSAEIQSICSKNGTEYLWQGDPSYWAGRAPTLFPYVGRLTEQAYTYENQRYSMGIHGFTLDAEFRLEFLDENRLRLALSDSPETLKQYPFRFCLTVEYYLQGNRLGVCYQVENRDEKSMYFGLGGHPGFRVPLEAGKKFEDYYLEFSEPCQPNRVKFTKECFITGEEPPILWSNSSFYGCTTTYLTKTLWYLRIPQSR